MGTLQKFQKDSTMITEQVSVLRVLYCGKFCRKLILGNLAN